MNIDKTDLFRIAIPGYIFLFVFFTFGMTKIEDSELMILLAGIPIGYLLSFTYRIVIYQFLLTRWLGEAAFQYHQLITLKNHLGRERFNKLKTIINFRNFKEHQVVSELVNQVLQLTRKVASIQDFRITALHSLGCSLYAILCAIVIIYLIHKHLFLEFFIKTQYLSLAWVFVVFILFCGYLRMFTTCKLFWCMAIQRIDKDDWIQYTKIRLTDKNDNNFN